MERGRGDALKIFVVRTYYNAYYEEVIVYDKFKGNNKWFGVMHNSLNLTNYLCI